MLEGLTNLINQLSNDVKLLLQVHKQFSEDYSLIKVFMKQISTKVNSIEECLESSVSSGEEMDFPNPPLKKARKDQ